MKHRFLTLLTVLGSVFQLNAACPSVPAAPSFATIPMCALLNELPWSTGNSLVNGASYGVGTTANLCGSTITFSGTHSLVGGNASTKIYIKNGETLRITGSINSSFSGSIYVMPGGTLMVDQQIDGGNIYVYGTLVHNPAGNVDVSNSAAVYVAQGGLYNAGNFNLTGNGKMIVEGSFLTTKLRNMTSSTTQFCLNNNGCAGVKTVELYQGAAAGVPIFTTDNGSGYIYYSQNTCPTISTGYTYSTSSGLTICAPNLATGSTCTAFGSSTQRTGTNCTPAASCATVVALPVTLISFRATKSLEGVGLSWSIAEQQNSSYFIVLRSANGYNWEEVGSVDVQQNVNKYSLQDYTPTSGTNYYKLQEVDADGVKRDYSLVVVTVPLDEVIFYVSPNPSSSNGFTIVLSDVFSDYQLQLCDAKGTLVGTYLLYPGKNSFPGTLPSGVYFATLKLKNSRKTQKIIVQ